MATQTMIRSWTFRHSVVAAGSLARVRQLISTWNAEQRERRRQREAIATLKGISDHALKDIGVHRSEVTSVVHHAASDRKQRYDGESV